MGAAAEGEPESQMWKSYADFQHIVALCGLEGTQWGPPVLSNNNTLNKGQTPEKKKKKKGAAKSPAPAAPAASAMVLTLEMAPASLQKALPEAFQRKKFVG